MKNLFGEEVSTLEFNNNVKKGKKHYIPMQKLHGYKIGFKCKNCKHFLRYRNRDKSYFKCKLWYISNSEATDIRANATACNLFEVNKNDY